MLERIVLSEKEIKNIQDDMIAIIYQKKASINFQLLVKENVRNLLEKLVDQANIIYLGEELVDFLENKNFIMGDKENHLIKNFIHYHVGQKIFPTKKNTIMTIKVNRSDKNTIKEKYPKIAAEAQKIFDYYFPERFSPELINTFFNAFLTDYLKRNN